MRRANVLSSMAVGRVRVQGAHKHPEGIREVVQDKLLHEVCQVSFFLFSGDHYYRFESDSLASLLSEALSLARRGSGCCLIHNADGYYLAAVHNEATGGYVQTAR